MVRNGNQHNTIDDLIKRRSAWAAKIGTRGLMGSIAEKTVAKLDAEIRECRDSGELTAQEVRSGEKEITQWDTQEPS